MRNHLRELSIRQRDGIPMRTLVAGINDAIGIRITTAIIDPIVDRSHIHPTVLLNGNTTVGLGVRNRKLQALPLARKRICLKDEIAEDVVCVDIPLAEILDTLVSCLGAIVHDVVSQN